MSTLYRMFTADDVLLYVGVTDDLAARLAEHAQSKEWWGQVHQVTYHNYSTRRRALEAEARAIFWESPRHNVLGSTRYSVDWEAFFHAAEDEWAADRRDLVEEIHRLDALVVELREEVLAERERTAVLAERLRQVRKPTAPTRLMDIWRALGQEA